VRSAGDGLSLTSEQKLKSPKVVKKVCCGTCNWWYNVEVKLLAVSVTQEQLLSLNCQVAAHCALHRGLAWPNDITSNNYTSTREDAWHWTNHILFTRLTDALCLYILPLQPKRVFADRHREFYVTSVSILVRMFLTTIVFAAICGASRHIATNELCPALRAACSSQASDFRCPQLSDCNNAHPCISDCTFLTRWLEH